MRYFDAHMHVQFVAFDEDREAVFARAREAGVGMNMVGTQQDTSRAAVEMAHLLDADGQEYADVYATVGLHPVHTAKSFHDEKELGEQGKAFTSRGEQFDFDVYKKLAEDPKVIAIGECGLDYYRLEEDTKKVQTEAFLAQIELANTLKKPLMLHIRNGAKSAGVADTLARHHDGVAQHDGGSDAYLDALALVKQHAQVQGDVHFFAGSWDIARQFLDLGFYLSFTGVVTFTHDYDEVVRNTPLDRLLSETDAPYVTPVPHRGRKNEPAYIPDIVRALARIKQVDEEVLREQLLKNTQAFFGISV